MQTWDWTLTDQGMVHFFTLAPPINFRSWRLPGHGGNENEKSQLTFYNPTKLSKQRLWGETMYIARPLIHCILYWQKASDESFDQKFFLGGGGGLWNSTKFLVFKLFERTILRTITGWHGWFFICNIRPTKALTHSTCSIKLDKHFEEYVMYQYYLIWWILNWQ